MAGGEGYYYCMNKTEVSGGEEGDGGVIRGRVAYSGMSGLALIHIRILI